jgi:hypothetical protein
VTDRSEEWLLSELGEGWTRSGDGVFYPPGISPPDPIDAGPEDPASLRHRRAELVRIHERTAERAAAFPNAVTARQAEALRAAIADIDRRL